MGFSIKLAPGVRIRASSRGLRASVGPRVARVHVGGGRAGFSSGAGPVGFYTSLGGSRRAPARRSSTGTSSRSLAAAVKAQQAEELAAALQAILSLHRSDFAAAEPPRAPDPEPPDERAIADRHRKARLSGLGLFARQARAQAKAEADRAAQAELAELRASNRRAHDRWQAELDALWRRLNENDADVVLGTLAEAFEDNEAAAAPIGVDGDEASVVVAVPGSSAIPERRPTTTAAGNLSLKKLTKRELADFYKVLVCGYVLATVKEAFAVAPALQWVRIVAVRSAGLDAYGRSRTEVVLGARFSREALVGVRWDTADAVTVVNDTHDQLQVRFTGPSREITPLELAGEPDLAAVVAAVDLDELHGQNGSIASGGQFDVVLAEAGPRKIQVIKLVRESLAGLGLKEAKDLVESLPRTLMQNVGREQAEAVRVKLERAGARVVVTAS
ncbi:ribosomal protein L7/L12 [Amycolatopsis sp. NPDC004625]|uniref:ribosomal protein L7/L12 n=1 Tax=Amycolatopsis sp. NPDC004625 TaxID=3154670 RepID=UPI0033B4A85A